MQYISSSLLKKKQGDGTREISAIDVEECVGALVYRCVIDPFTPSTDTGGRVCSTLALVKTSRKI